MTIQTEADIYDLLDAVLTSGLTARQIAAVTVFRMYQPRIVGPPGGMSIGLSNLLMDRYGFLQRKDVWNATTQLFDHHETQVYETHFQCNGLVKQQPPTMANTPTTVYPYMPTDLCRIAAEILQSDVGRSQLMAGGCGIERVTQIRRPYWKDDSDQFEESPSFDFVLTYSQTQITPIVPVDATAFNDFPI